MDFREIQKLTQLLKQLKSIQALRDQLERLKELKEMAPQFESMGEQELEWLREHTDYDRDEWMALINQIKKST